MLKELNHKISLMLILTILLGVISTSFSIPENERIVHMTGKVGHTLPYFIHFVMASINSIILVLALLINERTQIDKWIIPVYAFYDIISLSHYVYNGWPEPKMLIVGCFFISISIFIVFKIFSNE